MAASNTAPVARHTTPTRSASGKPTPRDCMLGWRYSGGLSGVSVSGIDSPVPSTRLTVRPRRSYCLRAFWLGRQPVSRVSAQTLCKGSRWRALQPPPVEHCMAAPQVIGSALRCSLVNRFLAGPLGLQHLPHEHRHGHRVRVQPFAVLWRQPPRSSAATTGSSAR